MSARRALKTGLEERAFLRILAKVSSQQSGRLEVSDFSQNRPSSLLRLQGIVSEVMYDPQVQSEVQQKLLLSSAPSGADLWERYFTAYDRVVGFSPGYVGLIQAADRALPQRGTILDLGSGTGNFALGLALGSGTRRLMALERSISGLDLVRQKLAAIDSLALSQSGIYPVDLSRADLRLPQARAAVVNNVLCCLSTKEQKSLFKALSTALTSGSVVFLNEPDPSVAENRQEFLWKVISGAYQNVSPATEQDYALVTAMNVLLIDSIGTQTSDASEVAELAARSGFEVLKQSKLYYGYSNALVLRKRR